METIQQKPSKLAYNGDDIGGLFEDKSAMSLANEPDQAVLQAFEKDFEKIAEQIIRGEATDAQINQMLPKVREYYQYLQNYSNYGQLASDVRTQERGAGGFAVRHLAVQAANEGKTPEQIQDIMRKFPIVLAYGDVVMRTHPDFSKSLEYDKIPDYHYKYLKDPFKLSPYAWGGTLPDKFMNKGSWMVNYDDVMTAQFDITKLFQACINNDVSDDGVWARKAAHSLMNTALHEIKEKCNPLDMINVSVNPDAINFKNIVTIDASGLEKCKQADSFLILYDIAKKQVQ